MGVVGLVLTGLEVRYKFVDDVLHGTVETNVLKRM